MKTLIIAAAALAAVTGAALGPAMAASPAAVVNSGGNCVPGMRATTPGVCSLPGFHWALTTVTARHHSWQSLWVLLPNG
jgi:hypothetical protein